MFKYLNVEPHQDKLQDCVIRALSLGLGINYYKVVELLLENGKFYQCDEICLDCYMRLLDDLGYEMKETRNIKVGELAESFKDNILIIRIDGHLTCSIYGVVYDIWDCTTKEVTNYWIIE